MAPRTPIGQLLLQAGRIGPEQLARALVHQEKCGGRLGDALVALNLVAEPDLLTALARQHGVRYVELGDQSVPPEVVRLVPQKYARSRRVLPFALAPHQRRGKLLVATSAPQDLVMLDEVAFMTGMAVQPVLVGDRDLDGAIERHFGPAAGAAIAPRVPAAARA